MFHWPTLCADVHAENAKWWHDPATGAPIERNKKKMLQLILSEIAEAMEGERKGLMDDKLPNRPMPEVELADVLIRVADFTGGFGYRIGDITEFEWDFGADKGADLFDMSTAVCDIGSALFFGSISPTANDAAEIVSEAITNLVSACVAYAERYGYDLVGAVAEKRAFNQIREDHKAEARLRAGGKAW